MAEYQLVIYALRGCKYCSAAVEFVTNRNLAHVVVYLDDYNSRQEVKRQYNHPTWPIILNHEGESVRKIGGYTDLVREWRETTTER